MGQINLHKVEIAMGNDYIKCTDDELALEVDGFQQLFIGLE